MNATSGRSARSVRTRCWSTSISSTSWPSRRSAASALAPERRLTSRSSDRPPFSTATRISRLPRGRGAARSSPSTARPRRRTPSLITASGTPEKFRRIESPPRPSRNAPRPGTNATSCCSLARGEQVGGVEVVGQGRPDEQAALGLAPVRLGRHLLLERAQHRVAAGAVDAVEARDVVAPVVAAQVLDDDALRDRRGAEVGGLLAQVHLAQHGRRGGHPAHPHAGRRGSWRRSRGR